MHRKINNEYFITNRDGAIIVEFVFVILIITIFIKTLISVAQYQSTVGKLDRISYSLAGIVRERDRLYENSNILTQSNVNQLNILANNMLLASGINNDNFEIMVETLHFNTSTPEDKIIDNTKSASLGSETCLPTKPLREMVDLSPYGNRGRWIPLYQVTLCLPAPAWYQSLFRLTGTIPDIKSSAITIER
ncbi:tight adherence pilus pseudopilin TadF [Yersinia pekkanenii]|uniref:Tight adherance operon protein n=1 Tax=Yersinia pekkanenii TaxID=1288385 RepID=A0A0T9P5U9_9GAMM|nr:tight adherence pilus pseudopilin TadF [Yersinia pekkanenii]CNH46349.1 putative tight adherance operon protein [Yersinia pekkanenii]CRY67616.1 putative tight adherance operon protein [Yersinia pekkanenii]